MEPEARVTNFAFSSNDKMALTKIFKAYMQATINILFIFICVDDVTFIETQFSHLKLCKFIGS